MNPICLRIGFVSALVCFTFLACKSEEQKKREQAEARLKEATEQMSQAAKQMGVQGAGTGMQKAVEAMNAMKGTNAGAYVPVDFRDLKALLPAGLPDMKRTSTKGERVGMAGFSVATARAVYKSADRKGQVSIKILDIGGTTGPLAMMTFGWGVVEIDKEDENGYEKTTLIKGNKALEKYNRRFQKGEVKLLAGGRFLVEVDGRGVPMKTIKSALDDINLAKLAALKPKAQ